MFYQNSKGFIDYLELKTNSKKGKHSYMLEIKKILTLLWNSYFICFLKENKTNEQIKRHRHLHLNFEEVDGHGEKGKGWEGVIIVCGRVDFASFGK